MALPILDGNQTAATLSTIITGGEHIPAHTVVSLGSQAISDISNAVSSVQVSGTVTANVDALLGDTTFTDSSNVKTLRVLPHYFDVNTNENLTVDNDTHPLPISGTVTVGNVLEIVGVGYTSVAELFSNEPVYVARDNLDDLTNLKTDASKNLLISGTVTVGNSVTIGSIPAISGTVTANVSAIYASESNFDTTQSPLIVAGGVIGGNEAQPLRLDSNANLRVSVNNSVTIGSLPSGALTTRFGSVTTANTAQITSAVTNTSRKYLLAQNISAGTVTIGIGFSPTTTQGIQLTAGGGLTFDAFCPTGAVYWLGAVTGAAFTILEG